MSDDIQNRAKQIDQLLNSTGRLPLFMTVWEHGTGLDKQQQDKFTMKQHDTEWDHCNAAISKLNRNYNINISMISESLPEAACEDMLSTAPFAESLALDS